MTFRSYPNGFPQLRPVSPQSKVIHKVPSDRKPDIASRLHTLPVQQVLQKRKAKQSNVAKQPQGQIPFNTLYSQNIDTSFSPSSAWGTPHQSNTLAGFSPSLLRAYGRIYQRLGGTIGWCDDMPILSPQLCQHFQRVRHKVAQGTKIEVAMHTSNLGNTNASDVPRKRKAKRQQISAKN